MLYWEIFILCYYNHILNIAILSWLLVHYVKARYHCTCFMVMKQDKIGQWNTLKHHATERWNTVKQQWNSMKQQWNSMKQQWNSMKQQWNNNETAMKQHETAQWNTMNQKSIYKIDIYVVTVSDSRCFIGMKQRVSWPWNKLFHPDSRCFMTMKQCIILILGVSLPCFILIQHVSRCFTTMKQIVSLLIHPVSCWFNLFHHSFITVSSLFRHCFTSGNKPLQVHSHFCYASLIKKVTRNVNGLYRYGIVPLLTFIFHDS